MPRLSRTRLRDAERRAPPPFQPMTIVRTIVDPSPDGPKVAGVVAVTRTRRRAPNIERFFNPERADLLFVDLDAFSDAEIEGLCN